MTSPRTLAAGSALHGTIAIPGDKSISHRSLILSALAVGESSVEGLLESADVMATAAALRAMGATIERIGPGRWRIHGVGVGGLAQPEGVIDCGNSGTSARLLTGLIASHAITATITGDASLCKRPMARVMAPLSAMGAGFAAAPGERLPMTVIGACPAVPIQYALPVASAQLKSALLLAALNTPGTTEIIEPVATRDHSERMLIACGAPLEIEGGADGARILRLTGEAELTPMDWIVPGDPSSAAFACVAALIVPGSCITLTGIGLNPRRDGLYRALSAMGADIRTAQERVIGGEPVADLQVRHSPLRATRLDPEWIPAMIDEFPAFFVACAFAEGETRLAGLDELRVKESDRIATMVAALLAIGARIEETADGVIIHGSGGTVLAGGGTIATHFDHRIAMSLAVAALHCAEPVTIDDIGAIETSYPEFFDHMAVIGAWAQKPC